MSCTYSAVIKESGGWWIGWVREISGVNAQARTRAELLAGLQEALREAVEMNRQEADAELAGAGEQVVIQP